MIERLERQCLALLLKLVKDIVLNALTAVNPAGASVNALTRSEWAHPWIDAWCMVAVTAAHTECPSLPGVPCMLWLVVCHCV